MIALIDRLRCRTARARIGRSSRIFISYRRAESWAHAKLLADGLRRRFDADRVFLDTEHIDPGEPFPDRIETAVRQADVMLVVIGERWLDWPDSAGGRRLDNPDDWVRKEIALAKDLECRLIPALINQAQMPTPDQLPDALRWISYRQAVTLHDYQWDHDMTGLLTRLKKRHPGNRFASRDELRDLAPAVDLVRNAALGPCALVPALLVAIAAVWTRNPWLGLGSVALYLSLSSITFFTLSEAMKVGSGTGGRATTPRGRDPSHEEARPF